MLLELTINNFAIIPHLHLEFYRGMTVLTGETGAGKSIIIDAMGLLAGGRASSDYIREGEKKCLLEGVFEIPAQSEFLKLAEELGVDLTEGYLIVQRDFSHSGKSICRVNGRILTLANLRRIGHYLVDIQGQNDHQELLQPEKHRVLVDRFGSIAFKEQLSEYQENFAEYQLLKKQVKQRQKNEQSYVQRMDMLRFQQEEIRQANLVLNEDRQLMEEREKLVNFQKIVDALGKSYAWLSAESGNSLDGISFAQNEIEAITHLDPSYEQIHENIQNAYYLLQDATSEISRQIDFLEWDENRLEEVTRRLEVIRQLSRKYGDSIDAILEYYEVISEELANSDNSENQLEEMQKKLNCQESVLKEQAQELHRMRKEIATNLEEAFVRELKELYMENTVFEIRFLENDSPLTLHGMDEIEFYLSTNPGEPLKPLVKIASGGELSRILLALKTIFSKEQGVTSIIFDEVDTGVSGRVAQAIAEKIAKISVFSQVLCITHLPQVAAVANYQYYISKHIETGRTKTTVELLTPDQRVSEIARMLAGSEVTELTKEHAKELLELARKEKKKRA